MYSFEILFGLYPDVIPFPTMKPFFDDFLYPPIHFLNHKSIALINTFNAASCAISTNRCATCKSF